MTAEHYRPSQDTLKHLLSQANHNGGTVTSGPCRSLSLSLGSSDSIRPSYCCDYVERSDGNVVACILAYRLNSSRAANSQMRTDGCMVIQRDGTMDGVTRAIPHQLFRSRDRHLHHHHRTPTTTSPDFANATSYSYTIYSPPTHAEADKYVAARTTRHDH